jgi:hypothetical protein
LSFLLFLLIRLVEVPHDRNLAAELHLSAVDRDPVDAARFVSRSPSCRACGARLRAKGQKEEDSKRRREQENGSKAIRLSRQAFNHRQSSAQL